MTPLDSELNLRVAVNPGKKRIRYYTSSHHLGGFGPAVASDDNKVNLQEVVVEAEFPEREHSPLKRADRAKSASKQEEFTSGI